MSSAKKDVLAAGGCPRLYGGNIEERASACHLVRFILVSILVLVHCVDSFRDGNRSGVDKELRVFLNKNNVCADSEMESFPINYISSGRTRVSVVAMSALSAATTFEWLAIEFEQFERQLGKTSAVFIPHKLEAAAGGGRLLTEADAQLSKTKGRAVQERSSGAAAGYFMLERAAHILHVCGHPWSAPLGRVNPTRVLANVREFLSVRDFAAVQRLLLLLSAVEERLAVRLQGMHVGARVCAMIQPIYPATAAPAAEAVAGLAMGLVPLLGGPGGDGAAIFAAPPSGRAPADGAEGAASKASKGLRGGKRAKAVALRALARTLPAAPADAPSTPPPMPPTEAPPTRRSLWAADELGAAEAPTPAGPDFKAELESRFKFACKDAVVTARWLQSDEISAVEFADLGLLEEGDVREFAKGLSKTGATKLVSAWRTCGERVAGGRGSVGGGTPGGYISVSVPISKRVTTTTPPPGSNHPFAAAAAVVSPHVVAKGTRSRRPRSPGR